MQASLSDYHIMLHYGINEYGLIDDIVWPLRLYQNLFI